MDTSFSDSTQLLTQAQNFYAAQNPSQFAEQITQIEQLTYAADFWRQSDAQQQMQKLSTLKEKVAQFEQLKNLIDSLETALFLQEEENLSPSSPSSSSVPSSFSSPNSSPTSVNSSSNPASSSVVSPDLTPEIQSLSRQLAHHLQSLQVATYLSGPYDQKGAIFSIHSGQGGTEAMDWAEMLKRLYERYFERRGWKYQLVDESRGEDAGIKSVSYEITSPQTYGYLKFERGTHRLVRLSPFNADNLRQTSFALVEVLPLIEETDEQIKIADTDIEWSYSRAGGPGGQNVNKVNSAVELHYQPLDLTIRCREERSQEQNRQRALKLLRAQLALLQEEKQNQELAAAKGEFRLASWGNQIRNYVLHPYHLVKDTRTNVETSDTEAVLDGDIDLFINAEIEQLTNPLSSS